MLLQNAQIKLIFVQEIVTRASSIRGRYLKRPTTITYIYTMVPLTPSRKLCLCKIYGKAVIESRKTKRVRLVEQNEQTNLISTRCTYTYIVPFHLSLM